MKKKFSQNEMEEILKNDTQIPESVDQRIQDTYASLGLKTAKNPNSKSKNSTNKSNTSSATQKTTVKFRKKHKAWATVAAAAALVAGLSVTAFAAYKVLNVQKSEKDGLVSYNSTVDTSTKEAHEIKATLSYVPDGYVYQDEDSGSPYGGKYYNETDGSTLTLLPYNAAEIYAAGSIDDLSEPVLKSSDKVDTIDINGVSADIYESKSIYEDSDERDKTLILYNEDDGYMIELHAASSTLSMDEFIKIAQGLKVEVLDSTVPYMSDDEIAKTNKEIQEGFDAAAATSVLNDSNIYKTKENVSCDRLVKELENNKEDVPADDKVQYQVEDIQVLDSISTDDYAKDNFIVDYDSELAPWLNSDGTLKEHDRYTSYDCTDTESATAKFVVAKTKITNPSDETIDVMTPMLFYLQDNTDGTYSELTFPFAASESWQSLISDGFTIYNNYQNIDNIKELSWTELAPGENQEVTTIYLVDSDHIDQAYLGFFKDYGGYNVDGQPVNYSGYVKVE